MGIILCAACFGLTMGFIIGAKEIIIKNDSQKLVCTNVLNSYISSLSNQEAIKFKYNFEDDLKRKGITIYNESFN